MTKVLVLCHGNVCRSPAAEAVLRHWGMDVQSAGLKPDMGDHCAMKKIRDAMVQFGYDLSDHRSQAVSPIQVLWADIILIMDRPNHSKMLAAFPNHMGKVKLLGRWADPPVERIKDPGFMKRGPEVDAIVEQIVKASLNFVREFCPDKTVPLT
jgi:protein-tyrosine phosphatase